MAYGHKNRGNRKGRRSYGNRRGGYKRGNRRSYRAGAASNSRHTLRIELVGNQAPQALVPDRAAQMATTPKRSMF